MPFLAPANTEAGAAIRGILLMTFAAGMFSCLDTTAKYLGRTMDSAEIAWLRYAAHVILLALFFRVWRNFRPFRTKHPFMHILRGLCLLGATFFNFWALRYLQLAEATAIMFAGPLVVTALAGPLLGEQVGIRRWIAVGIGFIGVLIVTRPGTGAMHWAAGLSGLAMLCYSSYSLLTRRMHRTETQESLMMLSAIVGVVLLAPYSGEAVTSLSGWSWVLALLMGVFGATGHGALVMAHRVASASMLAPFIYTQMVWMIMFGYVIFGDTPDKWTVVGTMVIAGAGLYILHRERVRGQTVVRDPAVQ
ncbi:DMT family transporter [Acuticoccus kandeliae]|uniref:DMT family transporter n=1 Tax=Acuticoccus kandeliae TaxID=2073160 RepID=UPI002481E9DD|nr:DMT family transporter [Acuticoccus kandeliae]